MTDDLHIAPWSLDHLDSLVSHADNINVASRLRNRFPHPYSRKDGLDFINRQISRDPHENFAVMSGGNAIGSIGLMPKEDIHRKNAEIGYWIAEPYWGKGILSKLLPEVVRYGFENFDITRIYAVVSHRNVASCRVLEKCGFSLEARFDDTLFKAGQHHDELIYAIRIP